MFWLTTGLTIEYIVFFVDSVVCRHWKSNGHTNLQSTPYKVIWLNLS